MAEKRMGFVIIESRCIDCRACMVACSVENDVPVGYHRNWVNTEGPIGTFPDLGMRHEPGNCMHCENPSCQRVCPTGATYTRPDGVVLIDYDDCIGCLYCIIACPYSARYVNEEIGGPDKCTFCTQRIDEGRPPACVETCLGKSRVYGDLNDPGSEVSRLLAENPSTRLLVDSGNGPQIYYIP
jgi:tetrathionate reductase subunit B